ncbi:MAG: hypothetical protein GTN78_12975, partial [Gemmatimonadales bacterium]|nr:hypothetical protein [Gemmatimonadales bacterium]
LRVDRGTIWVRLRRALTGKSKFEVETPTTVAAVRGTIFRVAVSQGGAVEVSVWEGTVDVLTEGRKEVSVASGRVASFAQRGQLVPARALTASEREEWEAESSILGPFLVVDAPTDGAVCKAAACEVAGRAEPGCEVFINHTAVGLSRDGSFSLTIALYENVNTITVTARAEDGSETAVVRKV